MRTVVLSAIKAGITRLRVKGGANPESLYDGVNCYVTAARTVKPRPGSAVSVSLPPGTIGLALFNGVFQVFSDVGGLPMPPGYALNVISHPDPDPDNPPSLVRIWKAEPFMGALYVVAEWSDGSVHHYYLQIPANGSWKPNTIYGMGELSTPTTPNGFTYAAHRLGEPGELWQAGKERSISDVVEPTTFNNYEYVAIEVYGTPPRSGAVEPEWIAEDGAIVIEEADAEPAPPPPPQQPPPYTPPPGYDNPGGGGPGNRPRDHDREMQAH